MWKREKKPWENKEIRVYLKRSRPGSCSRVTPGTAPRTQLRQNQPACAPPRLGTAVRMRTSLLVCCCVFAVQLLPSTLCLPARGSSRYKVAPVSERTLHFFSLLSLLQSRRKKRKRKKTHQRKKFLLHQFGSVLCWWCRRSRFIWTCMMNDSFFCILKESALFDFLHSPSCYKCPPPPKHTLRLHEHTHTRTQ